MNPADHTCITSKYLSEVQGEPRMIYRAECGQKDCPFREEGLTEEARDSAARLHQRTESRRTLFRGLSNAVKDDPKMLAQALAQFAGIATHEYDEWVVVVSELMQKEFDIDIQQVNTDPLREYYASGTDAMTATANLVKRHKFPLTVR